MTAPRWVAHFNKVVTNRSIGLLAPWAPGLGVVVHVGRKSGRHYRTPVNVFRRSGGYVIALTYGSRTDWVENVLAAGGCDLVTRGRTVHLRAPRLFHDSYRRAVLPFVRGMLFLLRVSDFLDLTEVPDQVPRSPE